MNIIILAIVAAFVLYKLYQVLGNKKYGSTQTIFPIPKTLTSPAKMPIPKKMEPIVKEYNKEEDALFETTYGKEIWDQIKKIQKIENTFDPEAFLTGARNAFEAILKAYDAADIATLKNLANKEIVGHLEQEIKSREATGERYETTLISIPGSDIQAIHLDKKYVKIVVKFTTDQVHLVKDMTGKIIKGNPSEIDQMHDVWTFEHVIGAPDASWRLIDMSAN
jgi:predicted lipid-binding transport protein (Tim44 family)